MKRSFEKIDILIAENINKSFKNPILDKILSKTNKGETFILVLIFYLLIFPVESPFLVITFTSTIAFFNDRFVLILKKFISRRRPSLKVLGKENNHPDLNHSFPSAHAANSMVTAVILYFSFGFPEYFFIFSLYAGLGRLLTLHHFLSDVIGGWMIGFFIGGAGVILHHFLFLV
ncbi:MAG: phosphatase PAP2 family protein [Leptospiraceae bacterium]|nr:phosphatase PAP2 family protein [Leptospiraceae bacterium]MCP5510492.1 phosphatase PAP2 family protein [Leptospiraceae bacterium]